jgi:hypothetical protein
VVAVQARSWEASLVNAQTHLTAINPPATLTGAGRLFVASLDDYIATARQFGLAASSGDQRSRRLHVRAGVRAGHAGDRKYDAGSRMLQAERQRLGLAPDPNFPGSTPAASPTGG